MLLFLLKNIKKHTFPQKYLLLFLYLKKFSYLCIVETNKQSNNPLKLTKMKTQALLVNKLAKQFNERIEWSESLAKDCEEKGLEEQANYYYQEARDFERALDMLYAAAR